MVEDAQNQRWYYREDGFIYPQVNPNLVLDIRVSAFGSCAGSDKREMLY